MKAMSAFSLGTLISSQCHAKVAAMGEEAAMEGGHAHD